MHLDTCQHCELPYEIVRVFADLGALVRRALHDGHVRAGHVGAVDIGRDRRAAVVTPDAIDCALWLGVSFFIGLMCLYYDIDKSMMYNPYRIP